MLFVALGLLSLAILIGLAIGIRFLGNRRLPSRAIGAVHGLLGVSGLSVLIVALLSGTGTNDRYGTASFGPAAAILAGGAGVRQFGVAIAPSLFACIASVRASWIGRRNWRCSAFVIFN